MKTCVLFCSVARMSASLSVATGCALSPELRSLPELADTKIARCASPSMPSQLLSVNASSGSSKSEAQTHRFVCELQVWSAAQLVHACTVPPHPSDMGLQVPAGKSAHVFGTHTQWFTAGS